MRKKGLFFVLAATSWGVLQQNRMSFAQSNPAARIPVVNQIDLERGRPHKPINLHIEKADGTPLANQAIRTSFAGPGGSYGISGFPTDAQGGVLVNDNFRLGRYGIYVNTWGFGSGYLSDVNVEDAAALPMVIRLRPGGKLRVVVLTQDSPVDKIDAGQLVGGAHVALILVTPGTGVAPLNGPQRPQVTVPVNGPSGDGDGVAEVDDVAPGHYRVWAKSPVYEPATQDVDIRAGETTAITVRLLPTPRLKETTSLKLSVQDNHGKPVKDTDVYLNFYLLLKPADQVAWEHNMNMASRKIHTDANGEASLFPVYPGHWIVGSWGPYKIKDTEITIPRQPGHITLMAQLLDKPH